MKNKTSSKILILTLNFTLTKKIYTLKAKYILKEKEYCIYYQEKRILLII